MSHIDIHKSKLCSTRHSFQPPAHSSSPQMMANPTNLPRNENPDDPAGPPVYSWDYEHDWWSCQLCDHIATRDHTNSRKHRARYSRHLQYPQTLPPANPRQSILLAQQRVEVRRLRLRLRRAWTGSCQLPLRPRLRRGPSTCSRTSSRTTRPSTS